MSLGLMIDKKTKRFVELFFTTWIYRCALNPSVSALSLRLFGKDITTVGQQKVKNQTENQDKGHHTMTPVEHAPVLDEDKEPTATIDDEHILGEMENEETYG